MSSRIPLFLLGLLFLLPPVLRAEDPPTADVKPAAALSDAEVQELIKQLDAPKFSDRQAASQKLAKAGAAVFPALMEAAMNGTREVTVRAIDILQDQMENGDEAAKKSAKEALQKIADSQSPSAANRAKEALAPKPQPGAIPQPGFGGGGIRVFGGNAQIQIQVQAIGGNGARKISIKNNNGVKEIEAEENDRKIKINDDPNQGIKIEITETKDGKETTRKVEAKDADDLKKKDPDAFKDYEKYSKGNGGIQFNGIQIQGGALPIPIQPGQIQPFQIRRRLGGAELRKQLEESIKRFEEQVEKAQDGDLPEDVKQKQVESLERVLKSIRGQLDRLPLDDAEPAKEKPEEKPEEKKPEAKKPDAGPVEVK